MIWLITRWRLVLGGSLLLLIAGLSVSVTHYRERASYFRTQRDSATVLANNRLSIINDMQRREQSVAALDAKYAQELADAKTTINRLHDDVVTGRRRLQLNATCPKQSTSTTGVDDATSPGLTQSAQRDYFTLRERIETARSQIAGLQDYIRNVCLAPKD